MKNNIKHFLIGALIASAPTALFVKANLENKRPKINTSNISINTNYLSIAEVEYSLAKKYTPTPTVYNTPKKKPIPTAVSPKTAEHDSVARTANIEVKIEHKNSEVYIYIEKYAGEYGVDKNMMYQIAKCESGLRSSAINGPFAGVYQFLSSTWISNRNAMGLNPDPELRFHAEEAVRTAAFKMSRDGFGAWPACQKKAKAVLGLSIQ